MRWNRIHKQSFIFVVLCILLSSCDRPAHFKQQKKVELYEDVWLDLNWIPPGQFLLGSDNFDKIQTIADGDADSLILSREGYPEGLTTIRDGFWMGQYEITVGQWKVYTRETGYQTQIEISGKSWGYNPELEKWAMVQGRSWREPGFGDTISNDMPACIITWNDAMGFCSWLNEKKRHEVPAGFEYRLPSEAEWEYACQGGEENTRYWWGNSFEDGKGRLNLSSPDSVSVDQPHVMWTSKGWKDGFAFASPVGAYGAKGENGFGLADMAGNISEWCLDNFDDEGPHKDPYNNGTDNMVIKGGSFRSGPYLVRCASRSKWDANTSCALVGFRVVLGPVI